MQTPVAPNTAEEEESELLNQTQHHRYRSQVARCLFLSQDRADKTFIVNELCQTMSNPTQQCVAKLKRLTRYLKRERQWGQVFKYEKTGEEVTMFHRFRLGRMQGNSKVIKRRRSGVRYTRLEGIHKKAENYCEEQRRGRTIRSSIGSIRIERNRIDDKRLGVRKEASAGH